MMRLTAHILTAFFLLSNSFAAEMTYDIRSKDDKRLGSLTVVKQVDNNQKEIRVSSEIVVKKLITVTVAYSLLSRFSDNKLQSNDIVTFRNHLPHDVMSTRKRKHGYLFTKNSKEKEVKDFDFCESMMYFNEPQNLKELYSEFDGVFKSVIYHSKENRYDLTNPLNKNTSKYFYSNGILERAIVYHPLITLYLYRK